MPVLLRNEDSEENQGPFIKAVLSKICRSCKPREVYSRQLTFTLAIILIKYSLSVFRAATSS